LELENASVEVVFVHQANHNVAQNPLLLLENYSLSKYRITPMDEIVTLSLLKSFFIKYGHVVDSYVPHEYGKQVNKQYGYIILASNMENFCPEQLNGKHRTESVEFRVELDTPKCTIKTTCIVVSASPSILAKISETQLKKFFRKFGKVVEVRKPIDTKLRTATHYAFVEFSSATSADCVMGENYLF
jgi:RNA recognition motif-containing protein